jgi:hypothetical protein
MSFRNLPEGKIRQVRATDGVVTKAAFRVGDQVELEAAAMTSDDRLSFAIW